MPPDARVRQRPIVPGDLPRLHELQLDPESNRTAVTNPGAERRSTRTGPRCWTIRRTPAVLLDGVLVGTISCFSVDGAEHVGYWIDRAYWEMGIASRALELHLREVTNRPLVVSVATSNTGVSAGARTAVERVARPLPQGGPGRRPAREGASRQPRE